MVQDYQYVGEELELFQHAVRWKSYFRSKISPYIRGNVLEVGSGIGATTRLLCDGNQKHWTCLEPDARLADKMNEWNVRDPLPIPNNLIIGSLINLPESDTFDSIIYIDVLEHIETDRQEIERAASHLNPGGALIVLAPAHQWLYTEFDRAIGHFRRYTARSLAASAPESLKPERIFYLDSVGMIASMANRFLLKSRMPTLRQIRLWDSVFVRASAIVDPLFGFRLGKTVVGVWRHA
ncbi:MAG: class I SAM-dependent methyltransferase [Gemmataceae bacterium]